MTSYLAKNSNTSQSIKPQNIGFEDVVQGRYQEPTNRYTEWKHMLRRRVGVIPITSSLIAKRLWTIPSFNINE